MNDPAVVIRPIFVVSASTNHKAPSAPTVIPAAPRLAVIRARLDNAMRDLRTLIDASKKTAEEALRKFGHASKS